MASTNDPFDFSRLFGNMGGFSLPGLVTPTLDIDELDKKIKDLKAVEGWLSMNLSMLQMSIQGLEVQRNTLSSIKAMSEAFNKGMEEAQPPRKSPESPVPPASAPPQEAASATTEAAARTNSASSEGIGKPIWPWELAAQAMQGLQEQLHQAGQQISEAQKPSAPQHAAGRKTSNKAPTQKATAKSAERTLATPKSATSTTRSASAKKTNTPTKGS